MWANCELYQPFQSLSGDMSNDECLEEDFGGNVVADAAYEPYNTERLGVTILQYLGW